MAEVFADFLSAIHVGILFFVDNDKNKHGKSVAGKLIEPVETIVKYDNKILITCIYYKEILAQLRELGLDSRVISIENVMEEADYTIWKKAIINESVSIIFDAHDGSNNWAGTEIWALRLASKLGNTRDTSLLVTEGMKRKLTADFTKVIELPQKNGCKEIIEYMISKLPIIVVQDFCKYAMLAAIYVKTLYPQYVKIVSVLHADNEKNIKRLAEYVDYTDKVFAVSEQVKSTASGILNKKIDSAMQGVIIPKKQVKTYMKNGVTRIGYAARLVVVQKRADLIIPLITALETSNINYRLEIAGSGSCYEMIDEYVKENSLEEKVVLLGQLTVSEMPKFWKRQDIFINLSEFEGCSLSMIEAMSYQCVPVVTNVSGVKNIVCNNAGIVKEIGDVIGIARSIVDISDPVKLREMGENAYNIVNCECNYNDYLCFWGNYLDELVRDIS